MTSNIISETIDENYPVAGQSNDSQGFRDNFSIIKTGLQTARSEISELQNTSARLDEDNNFLGNQIASAEFINTSDAYFNGGPLDSDNSNIEINYANGKYQSFTVTEVNATMSLVNFPSNGYGKVTLELYSDNTPRTVSFNVPAGTIKTDGNTNWTNLSIVVTSSANPVVVEFWSKNGGDPMLAKYVGSFV